MTSGLMNLDYIWLNNIKFVNNINLKVRNLEIYIKNQSVCTKLKKEQWIIKILRTFSRNK